MHWVPPWAAPVRHPVRAKIPPLADTPEGIGVGELLGDGLYVIVGGSKQKTASVTPVLAMSQRHAVFGEGINLVGDGKV